MSPLRILMLYRQEGLVQTHALYSMEAPWLPKSESGTRSPSPHLRHRGNAFSTKSSPSFSLEDCIHLPEQYKPVKPGEEVSRGGASAAASASPQHIIYASPIIPYLPLDVTIQMKKSSFLAPFSSAQCPQSHQGDHKGRPYYGTNLPAKLVYSSCGSSASPLVSQLCTPFKATPTLQSKDNRCYKLRQALNPIISI